MKTPVLTSQFKRDVKRCKKRNKDMAKLKAVMNDIIHENPLPPTLKDHPLVGDYKGHRDCHLEPDWVLIYLYKGDEVRFVRTGTHADLF
jgi:mRNA interferase YafQ